MSREKILSIIMPLYNSSGVIDATLNNLINSDFPGEEIEILLINDGSKDSTEEIALKYASKYNFVKYYLKENGGIASARNFGLDKATGKYVFFHDHDDFFETNNLDKILDLIKKYDYDVFNFGTHALYPNDVIVDFSHNNFLGELDLSNKENETNLLKNLIFADDQNAISTCFISIWAKIIKRDFLLKNNIRFVTRREYDDDFSVSLDLILYKARIYFSDMYIIKWNRTLVTRSSAPDQMKEDFESNLLAAKYVEKAAKENNIIGCEREINYMYFCASRDYMFYYCRKQISVKEFKDLLRKNNIRKYMIAPLPKGITKKQKLLCICFKLKCYYLVYKLSCKKAG